MSRHAHASLATRSFCALWLCLGVRGAEPPQTPAESLTLEDCVRIGLEQNLALQNKALDCALARELFVSAQALYDARFGLDALHSYSEIPGQAQPTPGESETTTAGAALQKVLRLGTRLEFRAGAYQSGFDPEVPPRGSEAALLPLESLYSLLYRYNPLYAGSVGVSFSQPVFQNCFGALDRAVLAYARQRSESAALLLARQRQVLAAQITDAYWNVYAAALNARVGAESLERGETLLRISRDRFQDGLLDETDVLEAEAALATRGVHVVKLQDLEKGAAEFLKNLVQIRPEDWDRTAFGFPAEPDVLARQTPSIPPANALYEAAVRNRPDLKALREMERQAELDIRIKQQRMYPRLDLVGSAQLGSYGAEAEDAMGTDSSAWAVGFQFRLPLRRTAEKSALLQSRLSLEKTRNDIRSLLSVIHLEAGDAVRGLETAAKHVEATRQALALHARKLQLEQQKFEQGRSTTHLVVQFQDDRQRAEMLHNVAIGGLQQALARCELVRGETAGHEP
ncbi:MAG: TolC family protein [Kiritimatiellae bacterium]|nr:TolC family protein [Kiritimatiellia bacterium]